MHNARGIFGLSFFCCVYDYFVMLMAACVFVDPVQHSPTAGDAIIWTALPSLPDQEGFAGPFAGTHNGALLVAGGAKFPDKMPWQGGRKAWYNRVFVLESPEDHWKEAGALPRPLGYGVSVSTNKGVVCMGAVMPRNITLIVFGCNGETRNSALLSCRLCPGPVQTSAVPSWVTQFT